jgi:thioredoxin 1
MIEATQESFQVEVLSKEGFTLVEFYADWCVPCKMMVPILEAISEKHRVVKVNVDKASELADQYDISGIPALCLFKNGVLVAKQQGMSSKASIEQMLESVTDQS